MKRYTIFSVLLAFIFWVSGNVNANVIAQVNVVNYNPVYYPNYATSYNSQLSYPVAYPYYNSGAFWQGGSFTGQSGAVWGGWGRGWNGGWNNWNNNWHNGYGYHNNFYFNANSFYFRNVQPFNYNRGHRGRGR